MNSTVFHVDKFQLRQKFILKYQLNCLSGWDELYNKIKPSRDIKRILKVDIMYNKRAVIFI